MDCCKKEEDCCPCADRIECLQAQIIHQTHPTPVSYTHLTLPTIYSV